MVPGLMPVRKCHSPQRGWVGHSLTCITDLCSRWAFPELWAIKHSPVDVNAHVRKDILCRIKFEKCCTFYSPPWVFSDHSAHEHINGSEKLSKQRNWFDFVEPDVSYTSLILEYYVCIMLTNICVLKLRLGNAVLSDGLPDSSTVPSVNLQMSVYVAPVLCCHSDFSHSNLKTTKCI